MKYSIEQDQVGKVYQAYPIRLTNWMSKNALEQFMLTFKGYKRADIMIKGNGKGREKVGTGWAVFIKKSNKQRRKEDEEVTMKLSDFLLGQIVLGKKRSSISLLKDFIK